MTASSIRTNVEPLSQTAPMMIEDRLPPAEARPQSPTTQVCPYCGRTESGCGNARKPGQCLSMRILDESEAFRLSLAHEIHEGLAQQLIGALLHLQGYVQLAKDGDPDARNSFHIGLDLLQDSIRETRRIAGRLRPLVPNEFGVAAGIEYLISELNQCAGPPIELQVDGTIDDVSPRLEITVFRILQELLKNAYLHSATKTIRVKVSQRHAQLCIEVEDWGIGFDPSHVAEQCFGLREVGERARLFGGQATVNTAPGKGTRVAVTLVIPESAMDAE